MSEQIFMQAPKAVPDGMSQHTTHKAFAMMDADNPADYQFNHVQGEGIRGTLVPVPSANGGIKGSQNPFGKIVVGTETKMINGRLQEVPFTPTWLGDAVKKTTGGQQPMAPPPPPTQMPDPNTGNAQMEFPDLLGDDHDPAAAAAADEAVQEQAMHYKEQARAAVEKQAAAEAELSDLISAMNGPNAPQDPVPQQTMPQQPAPAAAPQAPGMPSQQDMQQFAQMMALFQNATHPPHQETTDAPTEEDGIGYDPTDVPPTLVKLSGSFGTSRGKYKFVHPSDEFIILVYDLEANIFTPPASDQTFKLSCNGDEHDVYFAGVEFELPFYEVGVQVMIKHSQ